MMGVPRFAIEIDPPRMANRDTAFAGQLNQLTQTFVACSFSDRDLIGKAIGAQRFDDRVEAVKQSAIGGWAAR